MRIRNNIPGMASRRYGKELNSKTSKTLEKLSSGYGINRAGDDAAGLSVSEKIRVNLTGYERCIDNIREGMSLANTADAALQEVNDMLCRAKELCVTAANDTYTGHEREMLLDELNALYDEMNRIFESSRFNSTQLFRHVDGDYSNGTFEYLETVVETSTIDLREWGVFGDVDPQGQPFETAEPATAATVTLTMDSDVRSAADLVGKSFVMKVGNSSHTVSFRSGTGHTSSINPSIGVDDCASVQDAFDKLCEISGNSSYWKDSGIVLDKAEVSGNQVTLTFDVVTLEGADNLGYEIPEGDGTLANEADVVSPELNEVDSGENPFVCQDVTFELKLLEGKADNVQLTADDIQNLTRNTLRLYVSNSPNTDITFAADDSGKINLSNCSTVGDLRKEVADALSTGGVPAAYDGSGVIRVTHSNVAPGSEASIREMTSNGSTENKPTEALQNISVAVEKLSDELPEVTTITLPGTASEYPDLFSVKINDRVYRFFDSSSSELAGQTVSENYRTIDIKNMSQEQIYSTIRDCVENEYGGVADVSPCTGNQFTLTAKSVNTSLDVRIVGVPDSVSASEPASRLVLTDGNRQYGTQAYSISLDLASSVGGGDVEDLVGSGFRLNGIWYQFADDNSVAAIDDAKLIKVSVQDSYDDIADKFRAVMPGAAITVSGGVLTISAQRNTDNALSFTDGYDGLFNEAAGTKLVQNVEDGTKVGTPFATVDFSGYNQDNFRELYGKGFRVTCATCSDEYINVIFCYDKTTASFPESFDITKDGVTRTIHNMVVELKGMTDGHDIVNEIVTQLETELDHYTAVKKGNPTSVLEVYDTRRGDLTDANGGPAQAKLYSGVITNCIYTVKETFLPAPDDIVGDIEIDYRNMNIFANADGEGSYITIHLPYLTIENLKLDPPKPDFSTPERALETMERVLQANNAISSMRGQLGADFNRLQHAYESLTESETQAADAYSRIRDTDMAEMMTEQTKLSILQQAQQAAQAHTIKMPQQILELLR